MASPLAKQLAAWIDIDSTTGHEDDFGDALGLALRASGFAVETQQVAPGRHNVFARAGQPRAVFCTHLDTVPPFFGPRIAGDTVFGRGACDAKGQALAMLLAAERLLADGEDRIGFLFTVGEEADCVGAQHAERALRTDPARRDRWQPRYTILGEPTGGRFVRSLKGLFAAQLVARGVAGHSSQFGGTSAIHDLVGCCARLTAADWGNHPRHGRGSINIGLIEGGSAPNVIADAARASIVVRAVDAPAAVRRRIEEALPPTVEIDNGGEQYGPTDFLVPAGEDGDVVDFGTDAPHLSSWGQLLLCGAGSIAVAHTAEERIGIAEIEAVAARHADTVRTLLAQPQLSGSTVA